MAENERAIDDTITEPSDDPADRASDERCPTCYQCGSRFLRVHLPPVRLETGREVGWSTRLYRCANPRCGVTMCYPDPS